MFSLQNDISKDSFDAMTEDSSIKAPRQKYTH